MGEETYYPLVRRWLEKQGYYCGGFIVDAKDNPIYYENKGTKRLRIDVAGVKNIGTPYEDKIEVVAVEVRDVSKTQYRDLQDAYGYSRYAHKCYLATTGKIVEQDKLDASELGIGLLHIKRNKVKEILSPQIITPNSSSMIHFLHVLDIARCTLCGCFFEIFRRKEEKYESFYRIRRPRYFKMAHDHPSIDVLNAKNLKNLEQKYKMYRYICRLCLDEFFSDSKNNNVQREGIPHTNG